MLHIQEIAAPVHTQSHTYDMMNVQCKQFHVYIVQKKQLQMLLIWTGTQQSVRTRSGTNTIEYRNDVICVLQTISTQDVVQSGRHVAAFMYVKSHIDNK